MLKRDKVRTSKFEQKERLSKLEYIQIKSIKKIK